MQYCEIGKYIKSKRNVLKISLNKFAIENEIEPAILSRVENCKQGLKLEVLEKIAKGFNQTPAQFLSEFEKII